MTRETKVGLVVAASFVSLVSVVVWQKMKKGQDDANPVTIAVAPSTPQPKTEPKNSTPTEPNKGTGVQQTTLTIPGLLPLDPKTKVGLPDPKGLFLPDLKNDGLPALPGLPQVDPKTLPKMPEGPKVADAIPPKTQDDFLKELERAKLFGATGNQDVKPPDLGKLPSIDQFAFNGKDAKDKLPKDKDSIVPPPIVPPPLDPPGGAKDNVKLPADPKGKDGLPPPPAWNPKDLLPPPAVAGDPKKDVLPPPPVAVDPKKDVLPPPPIGGFQAKIDVPPLGVPAKDMPPLGVKPDPIPLVRVPNADTKVTSMQAYTVQEADTLPGISQRSYGSDKYSSALLAFNRAKNKDSLVTAHLLGNTPRLVKGMELIIPPPEFLSANYGQLIQESAAADNQVPFSIKPPTAAPLGAANPNAGQLAKASTPDPTRRYRVPDQGQYVIDIAAKSLNNPNRWVEILRLNPSLRPEFPIPGGTELQLPAN